MDTHDAYARYGPALVRKAERLLANREDSCDVVQSLFADLLQAGHAELDLPYLYRAVTNRCLTMIRDHRTHERLLQRETPTLRGPARTRCDDEVLGVDLLLKLAERLDGGTLEVLVHRYWDDLSQVEIAELTGQSRKTIGRRLTRIREEVVRLLEAREALR